MTKDDKPDQELLEFLKTRYRVESGADGTFVVHTNAGTYSFQSLGQVPSSDPFRPLINDKREQKEVNPFGNIGEDDANPNFHPKLTKKGKMRGMFPGDDDTASDEDPRLWIDPAYPSKGKRKGPEPDPDHEYYGKDMYQP